MIGSVTFTSVGQGVLEKHGRGWVLGAKSSRRAESTKIESFDETYVKKGRIGLTLENIDLKTKTFKMMASPALNFKLSYAPKKTIETE